LYDTCPQPRAHGSAKDQKALDWFKYKLYLVPWGVFDEEKFTPGSGSQFLDTGLTPNIAGESLEDHALQDAQAYFFKTTESGVSPANPGIKAIGSKGPNGKTISAIKPSGVNFDKVTGEFKWGKVEIHEKYSVTTTDVNKDVAFEDLVRPPWFSDEYTNGKIGKVYDELVGSDSILGRLWGNLGLLQDGSLTSEETGKPAEIPDDAAIGTTEDALDVLALLYSVVTENGDPGEFADSFGKRRIATLKQVMGDSTGDTEDEVGYLTTGLMDSENLEGFEYQDLPRVTETGAVAKVPKELDTRKERKERVLTYRNALLKSQGILG